MSEPGGFNPKKRTKGKEDGYRIEKDEEDAPEDFENAEIISSGVFFLAPCKSLLLVRIPLIQSGILDGAYRIRLTN